jgi:hypothetical protein
MRKLTTKEFIKRAINIHNDKYDYSQVVYVNNSTKVNIICSYHNKVFAVTPANHVDKKSGCPECYGNTIITTVIFIEKAIEIHGYKYDYSKVDYVNGYTDIEIVCRIHKSFWQRPDNHIYQKSGCYECGRETSAQKQVQTKNEFIKSAQHIHGNKYDYSQVAYISNYIKIEIICKDHGAFWQKPYHHTDSGAGCPKCGHNVSKPETSWLNTKEISIEYRNVTLHTDSKRYWVDAYDPTSNIIYEFYGDYWHGNPLIYNPDDTNPTNYKTFGDLYNRTIEREGELKAAGYQIISIWESDWKQQIKLAKDNR